MRTRHITTVALASAAAGLMACGQDTTAQQPATFERAGDVAFTCFDRTESTMVPLSTCDGTDTERFAPLALVTQTGRGEVASVDLDSGRVLDIDPGIPGFTFVRVASAPAAVVVPPEAPAFTYVASFGSRLVQGVPTARFHPDATSQDAQGHEVRLDGSPTDMVLGPDGDALFVAVPQRRGCSPDAGDGGVDAGGADDAGTDAGTDAGGSDAGADGGGTPDGGTDGDPCEGRVYRIPLGPGGTMGEPETALVGPEAPLPDPVDLSALPDPFPPSADADAYEFECSPIDMTDVPDDVAPPDPTPGTAFRPVALTLDEERGHLLVSDEGLPLIHRIDASTSTVLAPIAVGVPTRAVAVTPEVPAAADAPEGAETARYLYAIDETDRSVLAVDYTEGAASFGAVLPVTDGRRTRDRVVLPADARFLEVVTPGYPGPMCTPGSEADEARNPSQFRGVFLVAGLADGTLRTVDIHDLDLTVSDGTGSDQGCLTCPTDAPGLDGDADRQWFLRRHSPRITELAGFTFRLRSEPRFRVDGVTHSVRPDGTTEEDEAPDLSPLEVGSPEDPCPDGMTPARMADVDEVDDALICLRADPWVTRSQQWQAEWEGTITPTLSGRLPDNAPILEVTEGALCARGVIGATDVSDPASDATLAGYPGDVAVITSSLPATTEGDPACEQFAGDDREDMEFRIADAQQTRLELDPLGDASLELVRQCFPGAVGFRVRTDDVYSVIGEVSGFRHSIEENVAAGDGSCVVAAGLDGGARGRATPGEVFTNAEVAFRTDDVPGADQSVLLEFDVTGGPDPSGLPLGTQSDGTRVPVLLSAGRFHPLNERLYVVDLANRGLVEMGLQPFRLLRTFE